MTVAERPPASHSLRRVARASRPKLVGLGYLILAVALVLAVWELVLTFGNFPGYVLPGLRDVWQALKAILNPNSPSSMWSNFWSTVLATVYGFLLAAVIGIVLGIAMGEFQFIRQIAMPYIVAMQSVPKAALVPLIITWAGYGSTSKIIIGFMLAVFPIIVNTLQGVSDISDDRINLVRSLGVGRWRELRYVRWSSALPNIFVGLELAIVYSLLGVVVAEVLGAQTGLGVMIAQFETVSDTAGIFALLVVLAVIGFVLNKIVAIAHARLAWWDRGRNHRRGRRAGRPSAKPVVSPATTVASSTTSERQMDQHEMSR
jgi:NitT/TauT family transport system permease protein